MLSVVPDSMEATLADAVALQLAAWEIVSYRGRTTAFEDGDNRPLYLGPDEPVNAPAERVLLTVRPSLVIRGRIAETQIGFNWRGPENGDPLAAVSFTGMLYRRLHRLAHFAFGTVHVGLVRQLSAGSIGRDSRQRPGATANYSFRGLNPSVND